MTRGVVAIGRRPFSAATAAPTLESLLEGSPVTVFSKTTCPFCVRTKDMLNLMETDYQVVELNKRADGGAIQALLLEETGQRTVPNVFVDGTSIGGHDGEYQLCRCRWGLVERCRWQDGICSAPIIRDGRVGFTHTLTT